MNFTVERSRATAPLFMRAPHPPAVTPREYQYAGAEFALNLDHCLIGDQPGIGKTAQGILISNALRAKRTLVVCPASLRLNWQKEIWLWANINRVHAHVIKSGKSGVSDTVPWTIISYDMLRNKGILAGIMALRWDHVILDECHALKDPQGNQRTKVICAPDLLPAVTGRFTLLSGTILPNQPIECYNAVRLLDWGAIDCMSLEAFREHYYDLGGGMVRSPVYDENAQTMVTKLHWSEQVRNIPRHLDELQRRLRSRVMIRRLKSQVLDQLPPKQFHLIPIELNSEIKTALAHPGWAAASQLYDLNADEFRANIPIDGAISTARRMLGEAKVGPACDYVEELLASGVEKVVVVAWHTSVLEKARERLSQYGLVYMDGKTSMTGRQSAVDRFQKDPKVRVILGQTAVIGEGHTLAVAQDVVLLEPDWVPGRIEQAVDRVHRIGQEGSYVMAHLPVVAGSLDERIVATAIDKAQDIHLALDHQ